jgi:ABC-type Fe3+/spermidine/putrescine transport system ATPase subunit
MGPSGSGKTTLLKCIAGLVAPDSGKMVLDGVDITEVPPDKRNASLIFQDYALFPHMNVKENVEFGLKLKKIPQGDIDRQVSSTLEKMGLGGFEKRMPRELSGGEKQRVAVARSLVVKPKVLLYDEPLANLDYRLQRKMEEELKLIHKEFGLTSVYVTHNQEQALSLGDRIMVINKGVIEQVGRAGQIYTNPENVFTARFMGEINVLNGRVAGREGEFYRIQTQQGTFLGVGRGPIEENESVYYCVRPEKMKSGGASGPGENTVSGSVITTIYRGTEAEVLLSLGDGTRLTHIAYDVSPGAFKDRQDLLLHWRPSDGLVLGEVSKVKGIDIERLIYGK